MKQNRKISQAGILAIMTLLLGNSLFSCKKSSTDVTGSTQKTDTANTSEDINKDNYDPPVLPETEGWSTAHWIFADGATVKQSQWIDYRRDFSLLEIPRKAQLKIACDSKYYLFVNGEKVVYEGGLNRASKGYTYFETIDITSYLTKGKNSICVLLWYWGGSTNVSSTNMNKHYLPSGQAGLLLASDLIDSDNSNRKVTSGDGKWFSREDISYRQKMTITSQFLSETPVKFNAAKDDGWTDKTYSPYQKGWKRAIVVGNDSKDKGKPGDAPWNELRERPTPLIKNYGLTKVSKESCTVKAANGKKIYTYRMPYNMQIFPYIELGADTTEGKSVEIYTDTYDNSQLKTTYVTKSGVQNYESPCWINGDFLTYEVPEGVNILSFGYRQSGYAIQNGEDSTFVGAFDSVIPQDDSSLSSFTGGWNLSEDSVSAENNFYDEIWRKSINTLYVCMRDTYMDCPDRERGQYIGDVVSEMEEAFYALGKEVNPLSAKAIRDICEGQKKYQYNGKTHYAMSSVEPCADIHEIQVQELTTALGAWNYYQFTGDSSIADCFTPLYNYLSNYDLESQGNYSGTIRMRENSELMQTQHSAVLGQWTDWGDNQDKRIAINCWWYIAADSVLKLASLESSDAKKEQTDWLKTMMASVKDNFEKFWNEELKAYATPFSKTDGTWYSPVELTDSTHLIDERVNAMAVVFGLSPVSHYQDIHDLFMGTETTPAYENASIYMEKYVLQALYEMGYPKDAMKRLARRQMYDVNNKTSSTMPEYFSKPGEKNNGTKNHAWSASSITLFSRYAAGIEQIEAGYRSWRMLPQLGNFKSLSITVPSQVGIIKADISVSETKTTMKVTIPNDKATIYVPIKDGYQINSIQNVENKGTVILHGSTYIQLEVTESGDYTFIAE